MLAITSMRRSSDAFTLLEMMLAVAVAVMILVIAIPNMAGLFAEDALRKSFDDFDAIARKAQSLAMKDKRTMLLVWMKDGILLAPQVARAEDNLDEAPALAFSDSVSVTLERPAALIKEPLMEWAFWPSGACEPVRIHYAGEPGKWEAEYEPLTGRGTLVASYPQ